MKLAEKLKSSKFKVWSSDSHDPKLISAFRFLSFQMSSSRRYPAYLADKVLRDAAEAPDASDAAKDAYAQRLKLRAEQRQAYNIKTLRELVNAQQIIANPSLGEFEKNLANSLLKMISADNHKLQVLKAKAEAPGATAEEKEAYINETYKGIPESCESESDSDDY